MAGGFVGEGNEEGAGAYCKLDPRTKDLDRGSDTGARFDTVGTGRRVGSFSRSGAVDQVVKQSIGWSEGGGIGWLGGQVEVLKNGATGVALGEDGEDAHCSAARVAHENIDREHALHQ